MTEAILEQTVAAFNGRDFVRATALAQEGGSAATGRDALFWLGLADVCNGYRLLADRNLLGAETRLIAAMEKLRNFGFRYQNFDVTGALAGVRLGVEEIRGVRSGRKRAFDLTLLPHLKLAAKADI
jgi:hypothetical protein